MAMRVFNPGDVLAASDVNEYLVNTKYVIKPADTSRASNTTLSADPDLTIAVDANKSYYLNATVMFTAVNGTGDLKWAFTVPAGTVFSGMLVEYAPVPTVALIAFQASGLLNTGTQSTTGNGA